jgi:F-type H+-transporting ATPase subunit gamma
MKSVSNIQKITKAMKMVAASRLKPAQDKAIASRGMVTPFYKLLGDLPGAETAKTLMVPISSDKGLCGGINGNVVKVSNVLLETAKDKELIVYNRFVSAISFKPTIATVLSGEEYEKSAENLENKFDSYEVEGPDRGEFLLDLAEFKTGAVMYNALAENNTSELGSRMQSMESSSKNASEMLQKLTLLYNRTRQAAITTELIEIISGASALEDAK